MVANAQALVKHWVDFGATYAAWLYVYMGGVTPGSRLARAPPWQHPTTATLPRLKLSRYTRGIARGGAAIALGTPNSTSLPPAKHHIPTW